MKLLFYFSESAKKLVNSRKIVLQTRNMIMVEMDGKISTYKRVNSPTRAPKAKSKPTKKASVTNVEGLARAMPKCVVQLERLTQSDIDAKIAMVERNGKVAAIKAKVARLPCKSFFQKKYTFYLIKCITEYSLLNF